MTHLRHWLSFENRVFQRGGGSPAQRFAFAVISSLHSYLVLAYAGSKKAAEDVGFYYAANAGGRPFGIVLSGALTQAGGLPACLWGSAVMLALCLALVFLLPTEGTMQHGAMAAAE